MPHPTETTRRVYLECDECHVQMAAGAFFGRGELHSSIAGDFRDESCKGRIWQHTEFTQPAQGTPDGEIVLRAGERISDEEIRRIIKYGYDRSPAVVERLTLDLRDARSALAADAGKWVRATTPVSVDELHEDTGSVLFWMFPVQEPPSIGSSLDDDFPGPYTHYTPLNEIANAVGAAGRAK